MNISEARDSLVEELKGRAAFQGAGLGAHDTIRVLWSDESHDLVPRTYEGFTVVVTTVGIINSL